MDYQTFEPGLDLRAWIKCYWTLESPTRGSASGEVASVERQTIVPDGCMEMIFHFGDLYRQFSENGNSLLQPRCFVFGQLTRPLEIAPTGQTGIFSVRFHPNGFVPFATFPIKDMENTAVPLKKIFGKAAMEIEQQILKAPSTTERIQTIEAFLVERLTDVKTVDRMVKATVETILTANGQLTVEELSQQIKVNRRQLERKFSAAIGLSPKQLSKTIRLQATLKMLLNKNFISLTALAYEHQYYDQAHFIKDFKEFTGYTPKEFYRDKLKMSSLFYGME